MAWKRVLPPKRDRSDEFASYVAPRPSARLVAHVEPGPGGVAIYVRTPKTTRVRQSIRDSAKGEECEIRLPGCDGGGETTVWCHLPEAIADRGMGLKGIDPLGAYGCCSCHDIVDRRAPRPARMTEQDVALAFYRALARSQVKLAQKGLL